MQPDLILIPFGKNATAGTIEPIPNTAGPGDDPQKATWNYGFPQVTMTPLAAGGIPPQGQDFNGVLNAISEHTVFLGGGGQYKWSAEYVAENGGYAIGDVIQADDGLNSYVSLVNTNTANFNTTPASIGVSWALYAGRKTQSQATETVSGIAEIATQAEVTTGADDARIVTPAKLRGAQATQAEAEAGTDNTKLMTPLRVRQQAVGRLIGVQVFPIAGTFPYTPAPGTNSIIPKVQGAAGGSGGVAATAAGQVAAAYGGQAGTYAEGRFTSGFTGISVVVGAGGIGGATGANAGTNGGSSSLGGLISAPGGTGGAGGTANAAGNSFGVQNGNSGAASGANILTVLGRGSRGPSVFSTGQAVGGEGGDSFFGPGAPAKQGGQGAAAINPGSGSAGAAVGQSSGTSYPGTSSPAGIVIIYEYA